MGPQVSPFYPSSSEASSGPVEEISNSIDELSLLSSHEDVEKTMGIIAAGNAGESTEFGNVDSDRQIVMSSEDTEVGEEGGIINSSNKVWKPTVWNSHSAPPSPVGRSPRSPQLFVNDIEKPTPLAYPLTPRPQQGYKARPSLPPLQPLCITRKSYEDWSRVGFEEQAITPSRRENRVKNGLDIKLDMGAVHRSRDQSEPSELQSRRDKFAYYDKECSQIAEHIYLGSDSVARNRETLRANKITHVLNCVGFTCQEYFPEDLSYLTLWLKDSPCEDITSVLYDVFDYFEEVREQGGRVFVHCFQGVSRSTSLVIAYLMWRRGMSFEDAFQDVKAARGVTNPNMGFACQLLQAQKRVHAAPVSPNSVLRMYRISPHSKYDPLHLVPRILSNPGESALDSRGAFVVHVPNYIFVWQGKVCEPGLLEAAQGAAFQVVRYERAQGPIVLAREGFEPPEFWDSLRRGGSSAQVSGKTRMENSNTEKSGAGNGDGSNTSGTTYCENGDIEKSPGKGLRYVEAYDEDFELFRDAKNGKIAAPPVVGAAITKQPRTESGWDRLRCKFFATSRAKGNGSFHERQLKKPDVSDTSKGTQDRVTSENQSPDGCTVSASPVASPDPSLCSNSSLFSQESVSSASSRFPSPVSSTPSPFPSPSLSRIASGSSLSWSPSAPSTPSPASSASIPPLSVCQLPEDSLPNSNPEPSITGNRPLSLAQRRGVSPSLCLPELVDDSPETPTGSLRKPKLPPISVVRSPFPRDLLKVDGGSRNRSKVPDRLSTTSVDGATVSFHEDGSAEFGESSISKQKGGVPADEYFECEDGDTPYYTPSAGELRSLPSFSRNPSHLSWESSSSAVLALDEEEGASPKLFDWPRMERINMFDIDDLVSSASFILWVPRRSQNDSGSGVESRSQVYVWVGRYSRGDSGETSETGNRSPPENQQVESLQIGKGFLEQMQLSKDIPIIVVEGGAEPDDFWDHFKNG